MISRKTKNIFVRRKWELAMAVLLLAGIAILALFFYYQQSGILYDIPAIDVHEHIMLGPNGTSDLIRVMDRLNITKIVLLDTPTLTFGENSNFEGYDQNVENQLKMKQEFPGRFFVLYTYPPWDLEGPNKIVKYYGEGIDGLKFYNGVMYDLLGPINSTNMYRAYQKARELNLSVIMHVESQDPVQLAQFQQILRDFPDVIFICPHLCAAEDHLEILESLLDEHPNLYTDVGAWQRVGHFAVEQPDSFRQFIIKHQDRVMYASDMVYSDDSNQGLDLKQWLSCERDLLEKKTFTCFLETGTLTGLNLPHDVLVKIYQTNPERVYKGA